MRVCCDMHPVYVCHVHMHPVPRVPRVTRRPLPTPAYENAETCNRIRDMMVMCGLSCARSLRSLDCTNVGPGVVSSLLTLDLPLLRVLRLGFCNRQHRGRPHGFGWQYPQGQLGGIGKAFPRLTALDVGYACFEGGVTFADLDALVSSCKGLEHLDLSQVMTYLDFGPALRILAAHAVVAFIEAPRVLLIVSGHRLRSDLHVTRTARQGLWPVVAVRGER